MPRWRIYRRLTPPLQPLDQAGDLYVLAPAEFKRLARPTGLRKAAAGLQLATLLKTHYEVDLRGINIAIPKAQAHENVEKGGCGGGVAVVATPPGGFTYFFVLSVSLFVSTIL